MQENWHKAVVSRKPPYRILDWASGAVELF